MTTIYLIPGLACDRQLFDPLFEHLNNMTSTNEFNFVVLEHLEPIDIHEELSEYAKRLADHIPDKESIVIGVSLGGIIGIELSRHRTFKVLITISSVSHYKQVPRSIRVLQFFPIHRVVPSKLSKWCLIHFAKWFKIVQKEYRYIWKRMVDQSTDKHLSWGRHQVIHWRGKYADCPHFRIIGDKDHIFSNINETDIVIKDGNHAMVMNQAKLIAKNILEVLKNSL